MNLFNHTTMIIGILVSFMKDLFNKCICDKRFFDNY